MFHVRLFQNFFSVNVVYKKHNFYTLLDIKIYVLFVGHYIPFGC